MSEKYDEGPIRKAWRAWRGIHKRAHSGVGGGTGADGAPLPGTTALGANGVAPAGGFAYVSNSSNPYGRTGPSVGAQAQVRDTVTRLSDGRYRHQVSFVKGVTSAFATNLANTGTSLTLAERQAWIQAANMRLGLAPTVAAATNSLLTSAEIATYNAMYKRVQEAWAPKPLRQMGKLTDYVIGWREWRLDTPDALLGSLNRQFGVWTPGENGATCQLMEATIFPDWHTAPDPECSCGFYLRRSALGAGIGCSPFDAPALGATGFVWGAVRCSGRIIEHGAEGFRAEHVEIIALVDYGETARAAAKRYGVPCLGADVIDSYAYEFGRTLPGPDAEA